MTRARVQSVLLEAEGPLVIVLRDAVDCAWVATVVERSHDGDEYLCIPVSPSRLSAFRHGEVDLRSLFTQPEIVNPARVVLGYDHDEVEIESVANYPNEWLPDEGFFLTAFLEPVAAEYQEMVSEATAYNRPVLRLNLNPPEAREAQTIDADRLGTILTLFQNGLMYAHRLVTRSLTVAERKLRHAAENYTFEVLAFAPNSFEVHMQAKMDGDIFGYSPHIDALEKLDEIAAVVDDTPAAVEVAKANRGHFVGAVTALMQFVAESDMPLSYAWTVPQSSLIVEHTIRPEPARALFEALISKEELASEEVTMVGIFHKIDDENDTWRFEASDGETYSGGVAAESGVTLHGLTTSTVVYSIRCKDVLVEAVGTGRQSSRLELLARPEEVIAVNDRDEKAKE